MSSVKQPKLADASVKIGLRKAFGILRYGAVTNDFDDKVGGPFKFDDDPHPRMTLRFAVTRPETIDSVEIKTRSGSDDKSPGSEEMRVRSESDPRTVGSSRTGQ